MFDDDVQSKPKKSKLDEADLDITPMIDVTFLLLIFFMVTSTMQGTPDKDIPPARSGLSRNAAGMVEIVVSSPLTPGGEAQVSNEGRPLTLAELKTELTQEASAGEIEVMILAERFVPNGVVGDVESTIGEVQNVVYHFAVQEKR